MIRQSGSKPNKLSCGGRVKAVPKLNWISLFVSRASWTLTVAATGKFKYSAKILSKTVNSLCLQAVVRPNQKKLLEILKALLRKTEADGLACRVYSCLLFNGKQQIEKIWR